MHIATKAAMNMGMTRSGFILDEHWMCACLAYFG